MKVFVYHDYDSTYFVRDTGKATSLDYIEVDPETFSRWKKAAEEFGKAQEEIVATIKLQANRI